VDFVYLIPLQFVLRCVARGAISGSAKLQSVFRRRAPAGVSRPRIACLRALHLLPLAGAALVYVCDCVSLDAASPPYLARRPSTASFTNPFSSAVPTTYLWVSPNGSNSNSGTAAAPFQTIQAAINAAQPGTAIMVEAGTYTENLNFSKSGTSSAPIWLVSADGTGQAHIVPATNSTSTIQGYGVHDLIIQGFDITSPQNTSGDNDGIKFAQATSDFTQTNSDIAIINNTIHTATTGYCGIKISQTSNVVVLNNWIDGAGPSGSGVGIDLPADIGGQVAYNYFANPTPFDGLQIKGGSTNIQVHDNIITDTAQKSIWIGGGTGEQYMIPGYNTYEASNITVYNNLIHNTANSALTFVGAINSTVYNTLAYNNGNVTVQAQPSYDHTPPLLSANDVVRDSTFERTNWLYQDPSDPNAVTSSNISQVRFVTGTAGNDTLTGGNAVITTGGGSDTIVMNKGAGTTEITDFNPASDVVQLYGYSFGNFAAVQAALHQVGPNVVFDLTDGHILVLDNTSINQLTAADIVLAATTALPP